MNSDKNRFELALDGELAKIDFKSGQRGQLYMTHTEVPQKLEKRGVGHKLVREALAWVEKNNITVVPLCPFVKAFIQRNWEDYKDLVDKAAKL